MVINPIGLMTARRHLVPLNGIEVALLTERQDTASLVVLFAVLAVFAVHSSGPVFRHGN
jgi:hypothetical protein